MNLSECFSAMLSQHREGTTLNLLHVGSKFSTMSRLSADALIKNVHQIVGSEKMFKQACLDEHNLHFMDTEHEVTADLTRLLRSRPEYASWMLPIIRSKKCTDCLTVYVRFLEEM